MTEGCKKQLAIEKKCSGSLEAQLTTLKGQMAMVKELLHTSRLEERTAMAEVKTLDAQQSSVRGHTRTLGSKMPGFRACEAEEVEGGYSAFNRRLADLLSELFADRRRGIGGALIECMAPPCVIVVDFEKGLTTFAPNVAGNSKDNQ